MVYRICSLLLLLFLGEFLPAQTIKFRKLDNLNIPDGSLQMIATQEQNFVSVGYWEDNGWLMKLNACGGIIWSKQFHRGHYRTLGFDVVERPNGNLVTAQQIDTLLPFLSTQYRVPAGWIVEADPCGNLVSERLIEIPATNPLGIELLCPAATYALANTSQDGLVATGQTVYWELTDSATLAGTTRKTLYLSHFDWDLAPLGYKVFDEFPTEDTLVGYDVLSLPDAGGFVLSGAYFDASKDSVYLMAIKTDTSLNTEWVSLWAPAPAAFLPTIGTSNLSTYHAAVSLGLSDDGRLYAGGSQYLDTAFAGIPIQTIGAGIYELDPGTGDVLQRSVLTDFQRPLSLGLRLEPHDAGWLLAGSVLKFGDPAPISAVFHLDEDLELEALYTYSDGSAYSYLATSVVAAKSLPAKHHALAGVRFLAGGSDTTSSIIFFNAGAEESLPVSPTYYGGPIVQIEEVNVLDTAFCSPILPPAGCTDLATGAVEMLRRSEVLVYPNPATDWLRLDFSAPTEATFSLRMVDLLGREQQAVVIPAGTPSFDWKLEHPKSGMFVLMVGNQVIQKVLIQ